MAPSGIVQDRNRLTGSLSSTSNPRLDVKFLFGGPPFLDDDFHPPYGPNDFEAEPSKEGHRDLAKDTKFKSPPKGPPMGSSVGRLGKRGGGTLGGFVNLAIGDRVHRGWLTNRHVAWFPVVEQR